MKTLLYKKLSHCLIPIRLRGWGVKGSELMDCQCFMDGWVHFNFITWWFFKLKVNALPTKAKKCKQFFIGIFIFQKVFHKSWHLRKKFSNSDAWLGFKPTLSTLMANMLPSYYEGLEWIIVKPLESDDKRLKISKCTLGPTGLN